MKLGPRIVEAEPLEGFRLRLTFTDGTVGTVDLAPRIAGRGGVFAPLNDPAVFRQVRVDRDFGTVVWPNDVDLDPDVLFASLEVESAGKPR